MAPDGQNPDGSQSFAYPGDLFVHIAKIALIGAFLLPATAMVAVAAGPHPAFKARHHNFEAMGKAMKGTADELKKPSPNVAVIRAHANTLVATSAKVKGHFPKGTGPEAGVKTDALPAIWQRPVEFNAAADRLVGAAKGLQGAAATGDLARIQPAVGAVGGSCKNCHDNFRKPRS